VKTNQKRNRNKGKDVEGPCPCWKCANAECMLMPTASVPNWLRVWAVEKWLATKPCSTLSSESLEMFNALLFPNQCGEGRNDLRGLGNLHLQQRVMRSPMTKSIGRTMWWCWKGGVLKRWWVAIRVWCRNEVLWNYEEWKLRRAKSGKLRGDLLRRGGWKRRGVGNCEVWGVENCKVRGVENCEVWGVRKRNR